MAGWDAGGGGSGLPDSDRAVLDAIDQAQRDRAASDLAASSDPGPTEYGPGDSQDTSYDPPPDYGPTDSGPADGGGGGGGSYDAPPDYNYDNGLTDYGPADYGGDRGGDSSSAGDYTNGLTEYGPGDGWSGSYEPAYTRGLQEYGPSDGGGAGAGSYREPSLAQQYGVGLTRDELSDPVNWYNPYEPRPGDQEWGYARRQNMEPNYTRGLQQYGPADYGLDPGVDPAWYDYGPNDSRRQSLIQYNRDGQVAGQAGDTRGLDPGLYDSPSYDFSGASYTARTAYADPEAKSLQQQFPNVDLNDPWFTDPETMRAQFDSDLAAIQAWFETGQGPKNPFNLIRGQFNTPEEALAALKGVQQNVTAGYNAVSDPAARQQALNAGLGQLEAGRFAWSQQAQRDIQAQDDAILAAVEQATREQGDMIEEAWRRGALDRSEYAGWLNFMNDLQRARAGGETGQLPGSQTPDEFWQGRIRRAEDDFNALVGAFQRGENIEATRQRLGLTMGDVMIARGFIDAKTDLERERFKNQWFAKRDLTNQPLRDQSGDWRGGWKGLTGFLTDFGSATGYVVQLPVWVSDAIEQRLFGRLIGDQFWRDQSGGMLPAGEKFGVLGGGLAVLGIDIAQIARTISGLVGLGWQGVRQLPEYLSGNRMPPGLSPDLLARAEVEGNRQAESGNPLPLLVEFFLWSKLGHAQDRFGRDVGGYATATGRELANRTGVYNPYAKPAKMEPFSPLEVERGVARRAVVTEPRAQGQPGEYGQLRQDEQGIEYVLARTQAEQRQYEAGRDASQRRQEGVSQQAYDPGQTSHAALPLPERTLARERTVETLARQELDPELRQQITRTIEQGFEEHFQQRRGPLEVSKPPEAPVVVQEGRKGFSTASPPREEFRAPEPATVRVESVPALRGVATWEKETAPRGSDAGTKEVKPPAAVVEGGLASAHRDVTTVASPAGDARTLRATNRDAPVILSLKPGTIVEFGIPTVYDASTKQLRAYVDRLPPGVTVRIVTNGQVKLAHWMAEYARSRGLEVSVVDPPPAKRAVSSSRAPLGNERRALPGLVARDREPIPWSDQPSPRAIRAAKQSRIPSDELPFYERAVRALLEPDFEPGAGGLRMLDSRWRERFGVTPEVARTWLRQMRLEGILRATGKGLRPGDMSLKALEALEPLRRATAPAPRAGLAVLPLEERYRMFLSRVSRSRRVQGLLQELGPDVRSALEGEWSTRIRGQVRARMAEEFGPKWTSLDGAMREFDARLSRALLDEERYVNFARSWLRRIPNDLVDFRRDGPPQFSVVGRDEVGKRIFLQDRENGRVVAFSGEVKFRNAAGRPLVARLERGELVVRELYGGREVARRGKGVLLQAVAQNPVLFRRLAEKRGWTIDEARLRESGKPVMADAMSAERSLYDRGVTAKRKAGDPTADPHLALTQEAESLRNRRVAYPKSWSERVLREMGITSDLPRSEARDRLERVWDDRERSRRALTEEIATLRKQVGRERELEALGFYRGISEGRAKLVNSQLPEAKRLSVGQLSEAVALMKQPPSKRIPALEAQLAQQRRVIGVLDRAWKNALMTPEEKQTWLGLADKSINVAKPEAEALLENFSERRNFLKHTVLPALEKEKLAAESSPRGRNESSAEYRARVERVTRKYWDTRETLTGLENQVSYLEYLLDKQWSKVGDRLTLQKFLNERETEAYRQLLAKEKRSPGELQAEFQAREEALQERRALEERRRQRDPEQVAREEANLAARRAEEARNRAIQTAHADPFALKSPPTEAMREVAPDRRAREVVARTGVHPKWLGLETTTPGRIHPKWLESLTEGGKQSLSSLALPLASGSGTVAIAQDDSDEHQWLKTAATGLGLATVAFLLSRGRLSGLLARRHYGIPRERLPGLTWLDRHGGPLALQRGDQRRVVTEAVVDHLTGKLAYGRNGRPFSFATVAGRRDIYQAVATYFNRGEFRGMVRAATKGEIKAEREVSALLKQIEDRLAGPSYWDSGLKRWRYPSEDVRSSRLSRAVRDSDNIDDFRLKLGMAIDSALIETGILPKSRWDDWPGTRLGNAIRNFSYNALLAYNPGFLAKQWIDRTFRTNVDTRLAGVFAGENLRGAERRSTELGRDGLSGVVEPDYVWKNTGYAGIDEPYRKPWIARGQKNPAGWWLDKMDRWLQRNEVAGKREQFHNLRSRYFNTQMARELGLESKWNVFRYIEPAAYPHWFETKNRLAHLPEDFRRELFGVQDQTDMYALLAKHGLSAGDAKQVREIFASVGRDADRYGLREAEYRMRNYGKRTNLDMFLKQVSPFEFWNAHNLPYMARMAVRYPLAAAAIVAGTKAMMGMNQDLPDSLKLSVRIPLRDMATWLGQNVHPGLGRTVNDALDALGYGEGEDPRIKPWSLYNPAIGYVAQTLDDASKRALGDMLQHPDQLLGLVRSMGFFPSQAWENVAKPIVRQSGAGPAWLQELVKQPYYDSAIFGPLERTVRDAAGKFGKAEWLTPWQQFAYGRAFSQGELDGIKKWLQVEVRAGRMSAQDADTALKERKGATWDAALKGYFGKALGQQAPWVLVGEGFPGDGGTVTKERRALTAEYARRKQGGDQAGANQVYEQNPWLGIGARRGAPSPEAKAFQATGEVPAFNGKGTFYEQSWWDNWRNEVRAAGGDPGGNPTRSRFPSGLGAGQVVGAQGVSAPMEAEAKRQLAEYRDRNRALLFPETKEELAYKDQHPGLVNDAWNGYYALASSLGVPLERKPATFTPPAIGTGLTKGTRAADKVIGGAIGKQVSDMVQYWLWLKERDPKAASAYWNQALPTGQTVGDFINQWKSAGPGNTKGGPVFGLDPVTGERFNGGAAPVMPSPSGAPPSSSAQRGSSGSDPQKRAWAQASQALGPYPSNGTAEEKRAWISRAAEYGVTDKYGGSRAGGSNQRSGARATGNPAARAWAQASSALGPYPFNGSSAEKRAWIAAAGKYGVTDKYDANRATTAPQSRQQGKVDPQQRAWAEASNSLGAYPKNGTAAEKRAWIAAAGKYGVKDQYAQDQSVPNAETRKRGKSAAIDPAHFRGLLHRVTNGDMSAAHDAVALLGRHQATGGNVAGYARQLERRLTPQVQRSAQSYRGASRASGYKTRSTALRRVSLVTKLDDPMQRLDALLKALQKVKRAA